MTAAITLDTTALSMAFTASDAAVVDFGPRGLVRRTPICFVAERTETSAWGSVVDAAQTDFIAAFRQLGRLRDLPANWSSYGTDPPNDASMRHAHAVLVALMDTGLVPDAVVPSAEAGVGFVFRRGNLYADIECLNDGSVLAVTSDRQTQPAAWEVEPDYLGLRNAIGRIRTHLAR